MKVSPKGVKPSLKCIVFSNLKSNRDCRPSLFTLIFIVFGSKYLIIPIPCYVEIAIVFLRPAKLFTTLFKSQTFRNKTQEKPKLQ